MQLKISSAKWRLFCFGLSVLMYCRICGSRGLSEWTESNMSRRSSDNDRTYFTMMTSSNGNIFHATGLLCGEFTGDRCKSVYRGRMAFCYAYTLFSRQLNGFFLVSDAYMIIFDLKISSYMCYLDVMDKYTSTQFIKSFVWSTGVIQIWNKLPAIYLSVFFHNVVRITTLSSNLTTGVWSWWRHRFWPFVRGIHRWIPLTKAGDV